MLRFGIDLGGTKIEACALDARGTLLARIRIATEAEGGYAHIVERIALLYRRVLADAGCDASAPHALGIGTPGSISPASGLLRNSNTVALNGRPLAQDLAQRLGKRPRIENDANCFALAEALHGAGQGHALVFGVILGTGCGGGIIWNGRIHRGRNALGGEWGHTSIDPAGPACYCGQRGCVETFVSGSGLERRYVETTGTKRSATEIFARAGDAGDPAAIAAIEALFARLGRALANLVDVLDPDLIVLGGGLSNVPGFAERAAAAARPLVFGDAFATPVVRHALGDSAGVIGAALLADS